MLLVDANVLLHATNRKSRDHRSARGWLLRALAGTEAVAFTWTALLAFVRLATHPSVFPRPLTPSQAISTVEGWVGAPPAVIIEPTRRHLHLLSGLLAQTGTAGNLVGNAHLAALALEHDATVISFDSGFMRFQGVRWSQPSGAF